MLRRAMALKILLIDAAVDRAGALERKLAEAGFSDVACITGKCDLAAAVTRCAPDLIIVDMASPDRDALDGIHTLSRSAPRPIVMFSDADDPDFIAQAIGAGVCSYNLSGVADKDVKPIVAAAIALFQRYSRVETELAAAKAELEERRQIERAKAILMRNRKMTEPEAHRWLQRKAMNDNCRMIDVVAALLKKEEADADGR